MGATQQTYRGLVLLCLIATTPPVLAVMVALAVLWVKRDSQSDNRPLQSANNQVTSSSTDKSRFGEGIHQTKEDDSYPPVLSDPRYMGTSASTCVENLGDKDWQTAKLALAYLILMGDEAVPHLEKKLRTGSEQERAFASEGLRLMVVENKSQNAFEALVRGAKCSDVNSNICSLKQLGNLGSRARPALSVIEKKKQSSNPIVVKTAEDASVAVNR